VLVVKSIKTQHHVLVCLGSPPVSCVCDKMAADDERVC